MILCCCRHDTHRRAVGQTRATQSPELPMSPRGEEGRSTPPGGRSERPHLARASPSRLARCQGGGARSFTSCCGSIMPGYGALPPSRRRRRHVRGRRLHLGKQRPGACWARRSHRTECHRFLVCSDHLWDVNQGTALSPVTSRSEAGEPHPGPVLGADGDTGDPSVTRAWLPPAWPQRDAVRTLRQCF